MCDDLWSMLFSLYSSCCVVVCVIQCNQPEHTHWVNNILHYSSHRHTHTQATATRPPDSDLIFSVVRLTEDRDKWRMYVHGVANPRIEDGLTSGQNPVAVLLCVCVCVMSSGVVISKSSSLFPRGVYRGVCATGVYFGQGSPLRYVSYRCMVHLML